MYIAHYWRFLAKYEDEFTKLSDAISFLYYQSEAGQLYPEKITDAYTGEEVIPEVAIDDVLDGYEKLFKLDGGTIYRL